MRVAMGPYRTRVLIRLVNHCALLRGGVGLLRESFSLLGALLMSLRIILSTIDPSGVRLDFGGGLLGVESFNARSMLVSSDFLAMNTLLNSLQAISITFCLDLQDLVVFMNILAYVD